MDKITVKININEYPENFNFELHLANRRTEMTDNQLIAEVARVWVDGGGDAEGLDWCHQKLKEAVNAEIENRVMQEQERE